MKRKTSGNYIPPLNGDLVLQKLDNAALTVNLAYGFPKFSVDENLKRMASEAIEGNLNGYSHPAGIPKLRHKIFQDLPPDEQAVSALPIVCAGVSAGISIALFSILSGSPDEVIIVDPFFIQHKALAGFSGAKVVIAKCQNNKFRLPIEDIKSKINNNTKAILICSPNNPTGVVYSEHELEALVRIIRPFGIWLIADEIYRDFVHADISQTAPSAFHIYEKSISVRGFSKSLGIPGWRIGYVISRKPLESSLVRTHQMLYSCAATPFQSSLALFPDLRASKKVRQQFVDKAKLLESGLSERYEVVEPEGGYFVFAKVPPTYSGTSIFMKALDHGLGVMPGNLFGSFDNYIRMSCAESHSALDKAINILCTI